MVHFYKHHHACAKLQLIFILLNFSLGVTRLDGREYIRGAYGMFCNKSRERESRSGKVRWFCMRVEGIQGISADGCRGWKWQAGGL